MVDFSRGNALCKLRCAVLACPNLAWPDKVLTLHYLNRSTKHAEIASAEYMISELAAD